MPDDQACKISDRLESSGFGKRAARDHGTSVDHLTNADAFFCGSQVYNPAALPLNLGSCFGQKVTGRSGLRSLSALAVARHDASTLHDNSTWGAADNGFRKCLTIEQNKVCLAAEG